MILDLIQEQPKKESVPFDLPNTECHKKKFYNLESIQQKLGITQTDIDEAWNRREEGKPVYLCYSKEFDRHYWISNYE